MFFLVDILAGFFSGALFFLTNQTIISPTDLPLTKHFLVVFCRFAMTGVTIPSLKGAVVPGL